MMTTALDAVIHWHYRITVVTSSLWSAGCVWMIIDYMSNRDFRVTGVAAGRQIAAVMDCETIDPVGLHLRLLGEDGTISARELRKEYVGWFTTVRSTRRLRAYEEDRAIAGGCRSSVLSTELFTSSLPVEVQCMARGHVARSCSIGCYEQRYRLRQRRVLLKPDASSVTCAADLGACPRVAAF